MKPLAVGRSLAEGRHMFLIDGNQVLGSSRHRLVDGLGRLARAYGTPSIVVFDGPGQLDLPHGARRGGVRIMYAGAGTRAQDRILQLIEEEGSKTFTVVSPDRSLNRRAWLRGARTASVLLLRRALEQVERSVA